MAEPTTEKETSSVMSDSSLLSDSVSKLSLSPSENTVSVVPDWSLLPEELLHVISKNLCSLCLHLVAIHLTLSFLPITPKLLSSHTR
uniref:F-box domain-containing protein n=1 Tax=Brassica campestris TaxID=3711 RepID=A0A3P6CGJ1_BRACM|nr:unnamed protein product [Brassica rapa]